MLAVAIPFLNELVGLFVAAVAVAYICFRLRLVPIAGFLIAGVLIGPNALGLVSDQALVDILAEIGVILLLFTIGVEFSLEKLARIQRAIFLGGGLQVGLTVVVVTLGLAAFGVAWPTVIYTGFLVALSSTVIVLGVLATRGQSETPEGRLSLAFLIFQDLAVVLMVLLVPILAGSGGTPLQLLGVLGKAVALIVGVLVLARRVVPWVLEHIARTRLQEMFLLTIVAICFGTAALSSLAGVSLALGAFLAGLVVSESHYSEQALSDVLPLRMLFNVVFFVSVGMLLNPRALMEAPGLIAGALGIVLLGKPLVAVAIVWVMRYPFKVALTVAIALAQIGEFSFILSTIGRELGILTPEATNTLVAVSIVSIVANPLLYRLVDSADRWIARRPRLLALLNRSAPGEANMAAPRPRRTPNPAHRAVVIGYGPTGRTVIRLLNENGVQPTVVELNMDTVRALREDNVDAVYGDATRPDTLTGAGIATAGSLILTSAGMANSTEVIRAARDLNPHIRVLARAVYLRDLPALEAAGAHTVYSGEGEVALAFIEDILERLGATAEQIDRERARAHKELSGTG